MKKFPASNYVSPGRQNLPVDRREFNVEAHGDKIVRATIQSFTTEEQDLVKANLNITGGGPAVTGVVRYDVLQELTPAEAEQARLNIMAEEKYIDSLDLYKWTNYESQDSVWVDRYESGDSSIPQPLPEGVTNMYTFRDSNDTWTVYLSTLRVIENTVIAPSATEPCNGTHIWYHDGTIWHDMTAEPYNNDLYAVKEINPELS